MKGHNKNIGALGERLAALQLFLKGYRIIDKNYRIRNGEIDIIAKDIHGIIVFAEVKTRINAPKGAPADAVGYYKRKNIINTAKSYISKKGLYGKDVRFDVIEVYIIKKRWFLGFRINHIKNAFEV